MLRLIDCTLQINSLHHLAMVLELHEPPEPGTLNGPWSYRGDTVSSLDRNTARDGTIYNKIHACLYGVRVLNSYIIGLLFSCCIRITPPHQVHWVDWIKCMGVWTACLPAAWERRQNAKTHLGQYFAAWLLVSYTGEYATGSDDLTTLSP